MIEDVENFSPKLQFQMLTPAELPAQRQVHLGKTKASERVITQSALPNLRRLHKRISIDSAATCDGWIVNVKRDSRKQIRALQFDNQVFPNHIRPDNDVHWRRRPRAKQPVHRPVTKQRAPQSPGARSR